MTYSQFIRKTGKLILVFLISTPLFLQAQTVLTGTIKENTTGTPIVGALVIIDSTFNYSVSDAKGNFRFSGLKGERFSITVSHISYEKEKSVIQTGQNNEIILRQKSYLSEEVSVSATRVGTRPSIAFSDIDKSQLEKNNLGQDLPYLINMTPSTVATSDAGTGIGYTGLRIRGSDASRINVTINGVPINDAESHQVYWVDLPDMASSIENIQIQRGIGTSVNGAGAFGGSVNILTSKISSSPYAELNSSAGSFNSFKNTIKFGTGLINSSFAIEGRLSKIISDGYIDRATSNLGSYFLSGGYYGKKNSVRAVVFSGTEKTYQAWYGVTADSLATNRKYNQAGEYTDASGALRYYDNQTDNYKQDYYQLIFSHEFTSQLNANLTLHYTHGKGYYEEYKPGASLSNYNFPDFSIGDSIVSTADLIRRLWLSNDFYGMTGTVEYEMQKINLKAGISANRYDGDHYGEVIASQVMTLQQYPYRYYKNNATKNDMSAFVRATYNLEAFSFFVDLQERAINYTFDGFDNTYIDSRQNATMNFFNPKAGINYMISGKTSLYASVSAGHKEPVRDDFVFSTPANRPKAEDMIDYEGGLRYNSGKLSLGINAYYMNYMSQLILTGKINDVGEYIRESVPSSYRGGIELEGIFNASSKLSLQANLTISRNKIKEYREFVDDYDGGPQLLNEYKNTSISFSPEMIAAGLINYKPVKNISIALTGKYVGQQFLDNTSSENRKIDSYFINDLHLSYELQPLKIKSVAINFAINNLLDKEYVSNGYSYSGFIGGIRNDYNYYFPQAGRNWMLGLTAKF